MKSRLSLKSLGKSVLSLLAIACLLCGCSSSTAPTYSVENIEETITKLAKNEYKIDCKVKLVGQTLWAYMPVEDLFVPAKKPEKYAEKFEIVQNWNEFLLESLITKYLIRAIPEQEKIQDYEYNKKVSEKMYNVLNIIRRVMFSLEKSNQAEPRFFYLVISDIKKGLEIRQLSYYLDLKKLSYGYISPGEYQHRSVTDSAAVSTAIGDKEGTHLEGQYRDISLKDFITAQIQYRIKLKFQKPEVEQNADIDKEVLKIITYTLKIYDFKDFREVELENLASKSIFILNRAAVLARPID